MRCLLPPNICHLFLFFICFVLPSPWIGAPLDVNTMALFGSEKKSHSEWAPIKIGSTAIDVRSSSVWLAFSLRCLQLTPIGWIDIFLQSRANGLFAVVRGPCSCGRIVPTQQQQTKAIQSHFSEPLPCIYLHAKNNHKKAMSSGANSFTHTPPSRTNTHSQLHGLRNAVFPIPEGETESIFPVISNDFCLSPL